MSATKLDRNTHTRKEKSKQITLINLNYLTKKVNI